MPYPIGYYVSASSNTSDAAILTVIEEEFGSWLEMLTLSKKITWAIALLDEVARLEEIEIVYKNVHNIPGIKHLLQLSSGNKLALFKALVDYVQYADIHSEMLSSNHDQNQQERCKRALIEQGVDSIDAQRITPLLTKESMSPQDEAVVCAAWKEWLALVEEEKP